MTDTELVQKKLTRMAGFRNLVVHAYVSVDMQLVARILEHDLGDLAAFAACIRAHLPQPSA